MKKVIIIVLALVIGGPAYLSAASMQKPVGFKKDVEARQVAVRKAKDIRAAGQASKPVNGNYTADFEEPIDERTNTYYKYPGINAGDPLSATDDAGNRK